jgi:hypothetical protein
VKVGKDTLKMVNATTPRAELMKIEQKRKINLPQISESIIKIPIKEGNKKYKKEYLLHRH